MGITARFIPKRAVLEELEKNFPEFKLYYIEALQALFQLAADMEKAMDSYFQTKCKFSRARYLILMVLLHADDKQMTPNDIAKHLNVTRGNMTGLIDGLLADGLVTKIQDKEDRRQVWIAVTPKAHEYLNKILPDYFKRMSKFMSVIKKEEIIELTKLARKLQTGLPAFRED